MNYYGSPHTLSLMEVVSIQGRAKVAWGKEGMGRPKAATGIFSSTQMCVAACQKHTITTVNIKTLFITSKEGSKLVVSSFFDWAACCFSCLALSFWSCCSCRMRCMSHLMKLSDRKYFRAWLLTSSSVSLLSDEGFTYFSFANQVILITTHQQFTVILHEH